MLSLTRLRSWANDGHCCVRITPWVKSVVQHPVFFVLLVATIGVLIAWQGWKSRIPLFDLLPYIDDAEQFISIGRIPEKGTLTSFASYTPPGTTWLILPGMFLLEDPRLFEFIGSVTLYTGTLAGIFVLARDYFGIRCAFLSVSIWGLSELGLFFAQSLWPRGHPFFYVWMIYWSSKWVKAGNAKYLGAAIATWAIGMYVFMEIAPALFIIPAIWIVYRPPVRIGPLLLAAMVIGMAWYPYVRFEAGRGFADLNSQVFRQSMRPRNFKDFWCNPALAPESWQNHAALSKAPIAEEGIRNKLRKYLVSVLGTIFLTPLSNFEHASGVPAVLLIITIVGLALSFKGLYGQRPPWQLSSPDILMWLGISSVALGLVINELTVARLLTPDGVLELPTIATLRILQGCAVAGGIVLLTLRNSIGTSLKRLAGVSRSNQERVYDSDQAALLGISLIVPWVILLAMVGVDQRYRFWWLWPLQIVIFASFVTYVYSKVPRFVRLAAAIPLLFFFVSGNSLLRSRIRDWSRNGWSGTDAQEIKVVDYTASLIEPARKLHTSIGYHTYIDVFMATFNGADRRYKVGGEFDLLFKYRHGILNANHCAEGISAADEYRIVQTNRSAGIGTTSEDHIDAPVDAKFQTVATFGPYGVLKGD